jgi:hypothetical protein
VRSSASNSRPSRSTRKKPPGRKSHDRMSRWICPSMRTRVPFPIGVDAAWQHSGTSYRNASVPISPPIRPCTGLSPWTSTRGDVERASWGSY